MLELTDELRKELKNPLGRLMKLEEAVLLFGKRKIISVGDVVTLSLLDRNVDPFIAVYDFRSKRLPLDSQSMSRLLSKYRNPKTVVNLPGTLSEELVLVAREMLKKGGAIRIEGEEDLAALAFMGLCDREFVILYGQPDEGVVAIECSADNVKKAEALIGRMRKS